jgi:YidC/Oxa1 family membrane protein insertase
MEWLLEHIHVYAGTPWWVSISLAAFAIRAVLFKLNIDASDNGARMQAVRPLTDPLNKKMMAVRGDEVQKLQVRAEIQQIHKRAGIKLWRSFAPMIQLFTGYGMFVLLRGMALLHVPGMDSGGILWFQNLVFPDPLFILPTSTALILYWVLRVRCTSAKQISPLWCS